MGAGLALALALAGCGGGGGGGDEVTIIFPPPTIVTTSLPDGTVGIAYSARVTVRSGMPPTTFSVTAGMLPAGLTLNGSTGEITGTPTTLETQTFTIRATDSVNRSDDQEYTVRIGAATPMVELVSVAVGGGPGNSDSGSPAVSDDGRFVAFTSFSTNLIASDTNNSTDIFLRDRACAQTIRVSVATDGTPGDRNSFTPAVSSLTSGTLFVAYTSEATNLVADDTNNVRDIFVTAVSVSGCTLTAASTARVSVASDGTQSNGNSSLANLTPDGTRIIYQSTASNLDRIDGNNQDDTFVTDLDFTGGMLSVLQTQRIGVLRSLVANGVPRTTADIFSDTTIGSVTLTMTPNAHVGKMVDLTAGQGAGQLRTVIANDAHTLTVDEAWTVVPNNTTTFRVVTATDTTADIFSETTIGNSGFTMLDTEFINGIVELVSGTGAGQMRRITDNDATTFTVDPAWDPVPDGTTVFRVLAENIVGSRRGHLSADGTLAAYGQTPEIRFGVLVETVGTRNVERASVTQSGFAAGSNTSSSDFSADGNLVLFHSTVGIVVDGDTNNVGDLFLRDRTAETTERVNLANDSSEADILTDIPAELSGGGNLVVFTSLATNLVVDDRNQTRDVFLRNRSAGTTTRLSQGMDGVNPNGESFDASMSLDGSTVAFASAATNLIPNDITGSTAQRDIFVVCTDGSLGYPCAGILDPAMIIVGLMPPGREGAAYSATLTAVGGRKPLFWTVSMGSLPPGLFLDPQSGTLSGLPQKAGRYTFTLLVMDADRPMRTAAREFTLVVE